MRSSGPGVPAVSVAAGAGTPSGARMGGIELDVVLAYSASGLVGAIEAWSRADEESADPARWITGLEQTLPAWWPHQNS